MGTKSIAWSWVQSGNSFAQIAGVLAAFTISAIVLVLSRRPAQSPFRKDATPATQHLFYGYLLALYSFIVSALLFANVTGVMSPLTPLSYYIGMFAGTIMAIAIWQLLVAIIWSGAEYVPDMSLVGAKAGFAVVALVAASMITIDQGDYFTATSPSQAYWLDAMPWFPWIGLLLMCFLPLGLGVFAREITSQRRARRFINGRKNKAYPGLLLRAAYVRHNLSLWLSGIITTGFVIFVNSTADGSPVAVEKLYQPVVSCVVMGLVGLCVMCFIWGLPYRDSLTELVIEPVNKWPGRLRRESVTQCESNPLVDVSSAQQRGDLPMTSLATGDGLMVP